MSIERVYSRYKIPPEITIPEESFGIVRADGHKFGKLTNLDFKRKPLDPEFMEAMVSATYQMMEDDIGAEFSLAYVKSDEISFLLPPHSTLFGRHPGMLNANVSGHMSAMFTRELCERDKRSLGIFYADTFAFPELLEVEKFLAERQFEGYVNGINICMDHYWQRRNEQKRDIKLQDALRLLKEEGLLFPGFNGEEHGVLIYHEPQVQETTSIEGRKKRKKTLKINRNLGWFRDKNPDLEKIILGSVSKKTRRLLEEK